MALALGDAGVYVFDISERTILTTSRGPAARRSSPGRRAQRVPRPGRPGRGISSSPAGPSSTAATRSSTSGTWRRSTAPPIWTSDRCPRRACTRPGAPRTSVSTAAAPACSTPGATSEGAQAVPFDSPEMIFSGLYRPDDDDGTGRIEPEERTTARFVPLGVPLRAETGAADAGATDPGFDPEAGERQDERDATAAFKLRVALPGSLGPELHREGPVPAHRSARPLPGEGFGRRVGDAARRSGLAGQRGDRPASAAWGRAGGAGRRGHWRTESRVRSATATSSTNRSRRYCWSPIPGPGATTVARTRPEPTRTRRGSAAGATGRPICPTRVHGTSAELDDVEELLAGRAVRAFLFPLRRSRRRHGAARPARRSPGSRPNGANYPAPAGLAAGRGPRRSGAVAAPGGARGAAEEPGHVGRRRGGGLGGADRRRADARERGPRGARSVDPVRLRARLPLRNPRLRAAGSCRMVVASVRPGARPAERRGGLLRRPRPRLALPAGDRRRSARRVRRRGGGVLRHAGRSLRPAPEAPRRTGLAAGRPAPRDSALRRRRTADRGRRPPLSGRHRRRAGREPGEPPAVALRPVRPARPGGRRPGPELPASTTTTIRARRPMAATVRATACCARSPTSSTGASSTGGTRRGV